ncbi:VIT1/CCC1 transporter family protein [Haloplanus halophilus]|uniref:VIT1/CCC1 transporter family protein n=1 Tax=Haloplanus halophilus TaxID=2949993 RepID=UPI00203C9501|nr:VIT1/CCC1 transporter family protein [Haloplanus sp. GDY1]
MRDRLRSLRSALAHDEVRSISRRYFISNGFDGTLTSIGVTVGAYLSGIDEGVTVVAIGLGAAVGLCTSGVWSVWEIERAERRAQVASIERAMLTDLDDTRVTRRMRDARAISAVTSGLGPLVGIVLPLLPYLLEGSTLTMFESTVAAVGVGVTTLFTFGAYMGTVAGLNPYVAGVRMGLAGLVVALLNLVLPG